MCLYSRNLQLYSRANPSLEHIRCSRGLQTLKANLMFFYVISNPLSTTIVRQLRHVMDANSLTLLLYFYETVNNFAGTTHQIHLVWMSSDGIFVPMHTLMCWLSLSIDRTRSLYQQNLQMNVDRNYRMDGLIEICAHYKSFGFSFCFQTCLVIRKMCTLKLALPKSMN